jgi:multidrug efflux pump subunit AcrA (membrane-fusion protein)
LAREGEALRKKADALSSQLKLLIDESRELESAQARYQAAQAVLTDAELSVEKAKLALDRTVVKAPAAGRVLKLVSHPGARVMGLDHTAALTSSTVIVLYDPQMLQVRADVRLEDVPLVQVGQPVRIETASCKEPIAGTVLLTTSIASIQKNTLEVKVAIEAPPATIRPEMLVTATFLAPPLEKTQEKESEGFDRLLIPRQLVQSSDGDSSVWIVANDSTARRQPIKLGRAGTKELIDVVEGLRPTDKLISSGHEGLEPGARVRVADEDSAIGMDTSRL